MQSEAEASQPVMVVEDDLDIRAMVTQLLELEGYRVIATADGNEALHMLRAGARPCVILLDLMMPTMSGWQFREEQSRDPDLAAIPVVVITGDGRAGIAPIEAAGLLKKPIDLDVLLATIQRFAQATP